MPDKPAHAYSKSLSTTELSAHRRKRRIHMLSIKNLKVRVEEKEILKGL